MFTRRCCCCALVIALGGLYVPCVCAAPMRTNQPVDIEPAATSHLQNPDSLEQLAKRLAEKKTNPPPVKPPTVPPVPAQPTDAVSELSPGFSIDTQEDVPLGPRATVSADKTSILAQASSSYGWIVQTVVALGVVIALILLLRALLNKITGRTTVTGSSNGVELLSRSSMTPRHHVLLIKLGRRIIVVGESPTGLSTLADIHDDEEVAQLLQSVSASRSGSITEGFTQLMRRFNSEYHSSERSLDGETDEGEYQSDGVRRQVSHLIGRVRAMGGKGGVA